MTKDWIYTFITLGMVKVYVFDLMRMGGRKGNWHEEILVQGESFQAGVS